MYQISNPMGAKQRLEAKQKQAEITLTIYNIPETDDIINKIIKEVHSIDYVVTPTKGKNKDKPVVIKAMEKPELMFGKYKYILHYLARRKIHFTVEYNAYGYGIDSKELKKRLCEESSMVALMMRLLSEDHYHLIERIKNHSTFQETSRKYKLNPDVEKLVNKEHKLVLNRRDHGKMVEVILKCNAKGKEYQEKQDKANETY